MPSFARRPCLFTAAALLAASVVSGPARAEELKIAYVDVQRALNEVSDGRAARERLKKDFEEKQHALDQRQEELRVMKEDLDKQGMMLSAEAKQEKMGDMQKRMLELQQTYFNLQKELSSAEGEMTKPIFERMNRVLNRIADEEGYGIILERNESSILYARPHMDITNELIRKYNRELDAERKGGKPAGAGGAASGGANVKPRKKKAEEGGAASKAAAPAPAGGG